MLPVFPALDQKYNIIAPGVDIPSTYIKGSYRSMEWNFHGNTPCGRATIALVSSVKEALVLKQSKGRLIAYQAPKTSAFQKRPKGQGQLDAYKAGSNI